ncbi:centrosomal protein of 162 kDa isoform X2 [Mugil cephalus]|uniref:centrosomal protein of 162 kDa isoform X2 n=1 Tax=Mugil cephalus TaxID=48193 RepID=UPI001FB841D2|nr:centrosomal protein of 162 kDa isoform X2 [Mugil cephalus]
MSHRLTKEELDAQFEQFLKESVSDDSVDLGERDKDTHAKSSLKAQKAQKPAVSWWQDDEHSGGGRGLLGSGKSFRKSQPIQEEEEEEGSGDSSLKEGLDAASITKESTETRDSVMTPAVNMGFGLGLDTLEEEEEKSRFFAQLEAGASSTIDYSKLNRELVSTSSTMATNLRKAEKSVDGTENQSKARDLDNSRESPDFTSTPHYSEDFEDEENLKEPLEEKSKITQILARVSLYDSLDDTGGEDKKKDTAGSLDRGQSYAQSGGSEMEALHEAYRQIHVVEESDEHNDQFSSLEQRGRMNRPMSPTSPPHQSLQPASTIESDLPTAEELMKPIRPEENQLRGFTLRPVSDVELDQEKTSRSVEKNFPDVTYTKSQLKQVEEAAAEIKGVGGLTTQSSTSPDPPIHEMTWSIRREVQKLMQEQNEHYSYAGKAKKQTAPRGPFVSHPSTSSERKTTIAPVRGRRGDARTSVTSRSSGTGRGAATAKARSSFSSFPQHPQRAKSTKSQEKDDCDYTEPGLKVSSELVASVQSLVAVLQQQIDTGSQQDEAQELRSPQATGQTQHHPQISRDLESSLVEELKLQLALKERELQMMKEGAEELISLRQQNYLLQSKLRSAEEASQKRRWVEATDPAPEKLQQIDKELKEQETLIKGYQLENEKLYSQMKAQQAKSKANEEAMFNENQRLLNELTFTREQLNKTSKPVGNVCLMDHTQRITTLLAQVNALQRNEAKLSGDVHRLQQEKQVLEVDLQLMKKERDLAKDQTISTSCDKTFEMRVLEDKHREEVAALKKKLQWFAENQELLDRDAGRLKAATAEIQQLKQQVEKLKQEVGSRSSEQQRKARDKSVATKRMQDLERQVKELEQILRNRNPNSLPALIYAAATASDQGNADASKTSVPSQITSLLERRIQRLEAELESHDEEAKRSLRTMEQQFHRVTLRYKQQISELEQQLEHKQQVKAGAESEPLMSKIHTLEEELQRLTEKHQEREKSLHGQIDALQQQLKHKAPSSPSRHQLQAEAAFGVRIERLNQELATKTRTIQELSRTVERLQKERRTMLSVPTPRPETRQSVSNPRPETRQSGPSKALCGPAAGDTGAETFPSAQYEKTYQPTVFTGSHISEVLLENEALKQHVELLQLQSDREQEALKAEAAEAKEELCRLKEHFTEQLSSVKAEHLRVLEHLQTTHALEHSSSKVAELTNKLNTQEIVVKHLQEQLKELQRSKDALVISRTREDALQKQLTRLLQELKEAKDTQSPEVKLLRGLEKKILNMELRHQHREKELQQVVGWAWQTSGSDRQSEVDHWRRLAQDKTRELEAFRLELDSILDVLRHLQRQRPVLPSPDAPIRAPFPLTS